MIKGIPLTGAGLFHFFIFNFWCTFAIISH